MVEATTGWMETYPVPHATAQNTILGLEKQVLWRHGTPERIESDNGINFRNKLIDTWAKEHGIEWEHKKLGGGTARTAGPNWPKGYSIPYDIMFSIETGVSWPGGQRSLLGDRLEVSQRVPKQPQFPQPLLIRLVLQTLHQLRCPSLDTLQPLNVSLVVRGPKLNTVFEMRPHQCKVQGHNHFPSPAGHTISDTSQDAIGFLGHLGTLLAHVQPAVSQHPQALLCRAAFQPLFPKPVELHGVVVTQVQDLALSLVEPHTIGPSPSIQPQADQHSRPTCHPAVERTGVVQDRLKHKRTAAFPACPAKNDQPPTRLQDSFQSRMASRVMAMTQRNSLTSNFINWQIQQMDKPNQLASPRNEQRQFGNGAIFLASCHNLSKTHIPEYMVEEWREREARKGKEKRGEKRMERSHHLWIP
ncbi:hypothetical protein QYF61_014995 [Mycteria americana]|uniref:Integrase catalytic domain-containing protein n=1 Tax=Mycteria americana TaxID=33587 RepID=A0AAN7N273_MYCAM|nr:hypothetical protein QYF61_014995 [Mycteria americana]